MNNPIRRIGLNFAMGFLFFRFTGLHEIAAARFGVNTYVLYVLGIPAILCMLLSNGVGRTLRSKAAKYWAAFAAFLILAIPFSDWVSGSLSLVLGYLRNELSVLFLISGLVITWRECRRLLGMISIASIVVILLGQFFREETMGDAGDRLAVATGLTMGNANDYAAVLTLLLPFLGLVLITPGRAVVLRCAALLGLLFGLYMILSTGSRGGLIATLAGLVVMLFRLPPFKKLALALAAVVIGVTMWRVLPETITNRLATVVSDDAGGTDGIVSGESRQYLLRKSLLFTVQNPLLGVGPGQFINHEGLTAKAQGYHGSWHETHNSYTQISSEVGIPAAFLFIAALVSTIRLLSGTLKQARARPPSRETTMIAAASFCALIAVVAFCSSSFFLSLGYRFYFPALTGIAIVLNRAAQREWGLEPR